MKLLLATVAALSIASAAKADICTDFYWNGDQYIPYDYFCFAPLYHYQYYRHDRNYYSRSFHNYQHFDNHYHYNSHQYDFNHGGFSHHNYSHGGGHYGGGFNHGGGSHGGRHR